jgi:hypothetical protein
MRETEPAALPRGYFGVGAERISKALNLGNLMRSAHGFGASFTFTIGATYQALEARADTSKGAQHLPHYDWAQVSELALPAGCRLVGVELLDEAIDLPSFHHPPRAAYVLGPERGSLSPELIARCDYVGRWPARSSCTTACARWDGSRPGRSAKAGPWEANGVSHSSRSADAATSPSARRESAGCAMGWTRRK